MIALEVLTPDEKLGALAWPELEPVDQLSFRPEDWLIVCAGFEDRALGVLEMAISTRATFRVLLVLYKPWLLENKEEEIREVCRRAGIEPVDIGYDRDDLADFGSKLVAKLAPCRGRIFVDVSAMSRLLIVQTLVALCARPEGFKDCVVVYAEAESYPPSQAAAEAELEKSESDPTFSILFLSSGVFEVTVVPELSSLAMPGEQTRLVVFPSLDAHHLMALRAELQPSRFSFIEGMPPSPLNQWRPGFIARMNRLDEIRDAERCPTSTLLYRETLDCLLKLYSRHGVRERLLIAPTGSKMQTVAVGLFRSFVRDVQIVYPTPRGFRSPENYTRGVGPVYLLPLAAFRIEEP